MNTVNINHEPTTRVQYTGLPDGAVPIAVHRQAKFVISFISDPQYDAVFRNNFRSVAFVDLQTNKVFTNSIFDGKVCHQLMSDGTLKTGNIVTLDYEVGTGWIKTIDGKDWH